jgi:hypothetical protein
MLTPVVRRPESKHKLAVLHRARGAAYRAAGNFTAAVADYVSAGQYAAAAGRAAKILRSLAADAVPHATSIDTGSRRHSAAFRSFEAMEAEQLEQEAETAVADAHETGRFLSLCHDPTLEGADFKLHGANNVSTDVSEPHRPDHRPGIPADTPSDMRHAAGHASCYFGDGPLYAPPLGQGLTVSETALSAAELRRRCMRLLPGRDLGQVQQPNVSGSSPVIRPVVDSQTVPPEGVGLARLTRLADSETETTSINRNPQPNASTPVAASPAGIALALHITRASRLLGSLPTSVHAATAARMTWLRVPAGRLMYKQACHLDHPIILSCVNILRASLLTAG